MKDCGGRYSFIHAPYYEKNYIFSDNNKFF